MKLAASILVCAWSAAAFAPRRVPTRVGALSSEVQGGFRYDNDDDSISPLEKKEALENTKQWCLDRCIKLGHCEVIEDLNKMSTAQVQDFCKSCIINEEIGSDECDISFMFADDAPWGKVKMPDELLRP